MVVTTDCRAFFLCLSQANSKNGKANNRAMAPDICNHSAAPYRGFPALFARRWATTKATRARMNERTATIAATNFYGNNEPRLMAENDFEHTASRKPIKAPRRRNHETANQMTAIVASPAAMGVKTREPVSPSELGMILYLYCDPPIGVIIAATYYRS